MPNEKLVKIKRKRHSRSGEEIIIMKMWKKAAEMGGGVSEELNDKIQSGKLSD